MLGLGLWTSGNNGYGRISITQEDGGGDPSQLRNAQATTAGKFVAFNYLRFCGD